MVLFDAFCAFLNVWLHLLLFSFVIRLKLEPYYNIYFYSLVCWKQIRLKSYGLLSFCVFMTDHVMNVMNIAIIKKRGWNKMISITHFNISGFVILRYCFNRARVRSCNVCYSLKSKSFQFTTEKFWLAMLFKKSYQFLLTGIFTSYYWIQINFDV